MIMFKIPTDPMIMFKIPTDPMKGGRGGENPFQMECGSFSVNRIMHKSHFYA
jgi:hypothetical protein